MQQTLFSTKDFKNYLGALSAFPYIISFKIVFREFGIDDMANFVPNKTHVHVTSILREDIQ